MKTSTIYNKPSYSSFQGISWALIARNRLQFRNLRHIHPGLYYPTSGFQKSLDESSTKLKNSEMVAGQDYDRQS